MKKKKLKTRAKVKSVRKKAKNSRNTVDALVKAFIKVYGSQNK